MDEAFVLLNSWMDQKEIPKRHAIKGMGRRVIFYYDIFPLLTRDKHGKIWKKPMASEQTQRMTLCLPEGLQKELSEVIHRMGHWGIENTTHQVKQRFCFPEVTHWT